MTAPPAPPRHGGGQAPALPAPQGSYHITTWGCQMNELDAERAAGLLRSAGYERAQGPEVADVVLYMTCSVREKAEARVYHSLESLRGLKRRNPHLVVGVLGCVAEQEGGAILDRSAVTDLVVGPRQLERLPDLVRRVRAERVREAATGFCDLPFAPSHVEREPGVLARVTIMEGCNLRCTFCVVPNTRGPEACRPAGAIVSEVRGLVEAGRKEVLLLGQTVNAYRQGGASFADLLARIDREAAPERLKFVSSHPIHFTRELAAVIRDARSVVKWVNLPAQSGSDRVLKRMKRLYTRDEFLERVAWLRQAVPDAGLNTDIIVGFPGETERDFEETLELLDLAQFDSMYSFKYSPRPRTAALRLRDDVPDEEKGRRLIALNERQMEIQRRKNLALVGTVRQVLVDEVASPGTVRGRTICQRIVSLDGAPSLMGQAVSVCITAAGVHGLAGERCPAAALPALV